jgi:CHAD domain-containing protein
VTSGVRVGREEPVAVLLRSTLTEALRDLRAREAAVRHDADDSVHQLRVRCRRLRTDLRTFRALYADDRIGRLRKELSWLAESFDAARDLEVLCERVQRTASREPWEALDVEFLLAELREMQAAAQDRALRVLEGRRFRRVVRTLGEVAQRPLLATSADEPCSSVLPPFVNDAWNRLAAASAQLTLRASDADWHRTRILAKRARYTAETAGLALGHRTDTVATEAKLVQTLLGEHQDAVITAQRLTSLAQDYRGARALVIGRLVEREHALARDAELAFLDGWPRIRLLVRPNG